MFQLSVFQVHCLKTAAAYLLTNQGNPKEIPTMEMAVASFDGEISFPNLFAQLHEEFAELFLRTLKKDTLWDTPLLLNDIVASFLFSEGNSTLENTHDIRFYEMPNTTEASPIRNQTATIIQISGDENSGKLFQARLCAKGQGKHLLLVNCSNLQSLSYPELYLHARLSNSLLAFCNLHLEEKETLNMCNYFATRTPSFFILTEKDAHIKYIPRTMFVTKHNTKAIEYKEQVAFWKACLADLPTDDSVDIHSLANRFSFHKGQIKKTVDTATIKLQLHNHPALTQKSLEESSIGSCGHLAELGSSMLSTGYTWDDMILSAKQKEMLFHGCSYIKHKHIVYESWQYNKNFPYGKNLTILLEGPPGTGKTMSAQVIANELQLPIYQVNIAQTVSKYIGETEKKLNALFDEAERCNAILFIDEVESFLGKRTEIKDSHDKYANMETSFLLQKIESFKGILILATNHLEYIDEAFIRRIKFIVSLSMPQKEERLALWKNMFPPQTPLHNIDFAFLAENFQISGGVIKNIVLKSAFLARSQNRSVEMEHVIKSLQNEFVKQGKILLPTDFKEYGYLLR